MDENSSKDPDSIESEIIEDVEIVVEEVIKESRKIQEGLEGVIEFMLFGGRWLLAPLYLGLVLSLIPLVIKFIEAFWKLLGSVTDASLHTTTLGLLKV